MNYTDAREIQLVVFKLGNEEYGVPITQVKEINRLTTATKVPKSPSFVEGIINLRGQIIPIIDLKKRFELELTDYTDEARIMVIQVGEQTFGVKVDAVSEVLRLSTDTIERAPDIVSGIDVRYITGVAKEGERLLILLDLDQLLTEYEKNQLTEMNGEQLPEEVAQ